MVHIYNVDTSYRFWVKINGMTKMVDRYIVKRPKWNEK
jgi:hypothetical protein